MKKNIKNETVIRAIAAGVTAMAATAIVPVVASAEEQGGASDNNGYVDVVDINTNDDAENKSGKIAEESSEIKEKVDELDTEQVDEAVNNLVENGYEKNESGETIADNNASLKDNVSDAKDSMSSADSSIGSAKDSKDEADKQINASNDAFSDYVKNVGEAEDAVNQYADTIDATAKSIAGANDAIVEAQTVEQVNLIVEKAQDELKTALEICDKLKEEYEAAKADYEKALSNMNEADAASVKALEDTQTAYTEATQQLEAAEKSLGDAKTAAQNLQTKADEQKKALEKDVEDAKSKYGQAIKNAEKEVNEAAQIKEDADNALITAKNNKNESYGIYSDAKEKAETAKEEQTKAVEESNAANQAKKDAKEAYNSALSDEQNLQNKLDGLNDELAELRARRDELYQARENAKAKVERLIEANADEEEIKAANEELRQANHIKKDAQDAVDAKKDEIEEVETELQSKKETTDVAFKNYEEKKADAEEKQKVKAEKISAYTVLKENKKIANEDLLAKNEALEKAKTASTEADNLFAEAEKKLSDLNEEAKTKIGELQSKLDNSNYDNLAEQAFAAEKSVEEAEKNVSLLKQKISELENGGAGSGVIDKSVSLDVLALNLSIAESKLKDADDKKGKLDDDLDNLKKNADKKNRDINSRKGNDNNNDDNNNGGGNTLEERTIDGVVALPNVVAPVAFAAPQLPVVDDVVTEDEQITLVADAIDSESETEVESAIEDDASFEIIDIEEESAPLTDAPETETTKVGFRWWWILIAIALGSAGFGVTKAVKSKKN